MRIGIDLGGTKIEGVVMSADGGILSRQRIGTPANDYAAIVKAVADLVAALEKENGGGKLGIGIGTPGSLSPQSGLMKGCNSTCLNGKPLKQDLEKALAREVRMANDADCLALSEARDGAAAGARSVFGVILGTGVGGGIVINGVPHFGPNAIAGEWGHNPLPWPRQEEWPGQRCWCGRQGCIETWLSGPALARDYQGYTDHVLRAEEITAKAATGDRAARTILRRYEDRLARALATVINLLDPEVIVVGGGMSNIPSLYKSVPTLWQDYVFSDHITTRLVPAQHGDSSGVRGAARLWSE